MYSAMQLHNSSIAKAIIIQFFQNCENVYVVAYIVNHKQLKKSCACIAFVFVNFTIILLGICNTYRYGNISIQ